MGGRKLERKRTAKLGLIQVSNNYNWTVKECQDEMLYLAEQCLKEGADLVFMPECNQYKSMKLSPRELAAQYAAEYKERCRELARKYGAYVAPWDYELAEDGKVYNSTYILDRRGNEIGRYRKTHLTYMEEFAGLTPGNSYPVFDLDFARVGVMICFDNYFPECSRILALKGAELILFPLYGDTLAGEWEIKLKARAVDNVLYIASCHIHPTFSDKETSYTGLVDPDGKLLCKLTGEGSYRVVEFEPGRKKITCTTVKKGQYEDLRRYLYRVRNTESYGALLEKRDVPEWEDIIIRED